MKKRIAHAFCRIAAVLFVLSSCTLHGQTPLLSNPSSCALGLLLTDNSCPDDGVYFNPDVFQIQVSGVPGTALGQDVFLKEVRLIIAHEWAGDLEIRLTSPGGRTILLSDDNGGGDDNYGIPPATSCDQYVTFSAFSCISIKDGVPPFTSDKYQPEESLFLFNDSLTNPNGIWELRICDDVAEDVGTLEFVELVFEPILCVPVTEVQLLNVDSTTVMLGWDSPADCGTTLVEYGPPGFIPGTGNQPGQGTVVVTNDCPPFLLTGLAEETTFEIYLRKFCSQTGSYSENTCPINARTGCLPPGRTIFSGFDEETTCDPLCDASCSLTGNWQNTEMDDMDWIVWQGTTSTFETGPSGDVNGNGRYLYLEATGNACRPGSEAVLLSNCIRLNKQASDTCHLSFNYHMYGLNTGSLKLEVSVNGGFTWQTLWQRSGNQGNRWHKTYLSLRNYSDGAILQFRFVGTKGSGSKGDIALDEIAFYGSEDLGPASIPFYVDSDGDGYGDPGKVVLSCAAVAPAGFVRTGGDCNDADPEVNPGKPEIPCEGIDNNCSGDEVEDDFILPPPTAISDTICSGEPAIVCATPNFGKFIFWYGSPDGDDFLGFGECYVPDLPENHSSVPVIYRFYAIETDFQCSSGERAEAVIVVNPKPDIHTLDQPEVCPGQSFNLASLSVEDANFTGGTLSFHSATPTTEANRLPSLVVTPGQTTTYYFRMTTTGGCYDENSVTILQKSGPSLAFLPNDSVLLCLETSTDLSVQPSGGAGGYTYFWSTGNTTSSIRIHAAPVAGVQEVLRVTVTDAEGCFSTDSVLVRTTKSIDAVSRQIRDVTSCMGTDGSITLVPQSGNSPFRFQWRGSNGITGDTTGITDTLVIAGLEQGSYNITITDNSAEACAFFMRSVLVNGPDAVIEQPDILPVSCAGEAEGGICLNVRGSAPRFLWSTGDTTQCVANLPGGTYSVTVTDRMCQNILDGLIVPEPDSLRVVVNPVHPSCFEGRNGRIGVRVFGGNPPYQYSWNTGAVAKDLNGLPSGNYRLTVTDANGCQALAMVDLSGPPKLFLEVDSLRPISCTGAGDGYLKVLAKGGTGPYRYVWNTGSTSPLLPDLVSGGYQVTVTDFSGCQEADAFLIEEPTPLMLDLIKQVDPECVGDKNGEIFVRATGGTAPYDYHWRNGISDSFQLGLVVGDYFVDVRDARGCTTDTLKVSLTSSATLDLSVAVTLPECEGQTNGMISLQPNGFEPFIYRWENGESTAALTDIGVGVYPVTIEDGIGCLYDTTVTVSAPQVFQPDIRVFDPSCHRGQDGFIDVNLFSSGTPPITYQWSNGRSGEPLAGVGDGDYVLTITDGRGCTFVSDPMRVQSPPLIQMRVEAIGTITCQGDSTGFIELQLTGGVKPYTYNWIGLGATTEDIFNLPAGSYRLQAADANRCPLDTTFVLTEPSLLEARVEVELGDICSQANQNQLTAVVQGGTPPYRYSWSDGADFSQRVNVPSGDYSLVVEDLNGCADEVPTVKIRDRANSMTLDSFLVTNISCNGSADGTLTAVISGGTPPYRYHFSNNVIRVTNSKRVTIGGLVLDDDYRVTVTDLTTGCFVVSPKRVIQEPPLLSFVRDSVDVVNCFEGNDGGIYASVDGGKPPYRFAWYDSTGNLVATTEDIINIYTGQYRGVVIDANDCTGSIPFTDVPTINPPIRMIDSLTVVRDIRCKGDRAGSIEVWITGGRPPFSYSWDNGSRTKDLRQVAAGSYTLTVTDTDNCRAIFPPIVVREPEVGLGLNAVVDSIRCFGSDDGAISVAIAGGRPPYDVTWQRNGVFWNQGLTFLERLPAGMYTLTVKDSSQCEKTATFDLQQPDLLTLELEITPPQPPEEDGIIEAVAGGGTPPYFYRWSTGDTTSIIEQLGLGSYGITVTDSRMCVVSDSVLLVSDFEAEIVEAITVFPNPASSRIQLDIRLKEQTDLEILLLDVSGKTVAHRTLDNAASTVLDLDASRWAPGVYLVVLSSADGRLLYSGKLVISR